MGKQLEQVVLLVFEFCGAQLRSGIWAVLWRPAPFHSNRAFQSEWKWKLQLKEMVLLGACGEGWVSAKREPARWCCLAQVRVLSAASQVGACRSCNRKNVLGKGACAAPARGRGRKMLYGGSCGEAVEGLCSSPMTRCPVAASSGGGEAGPAGAGAVQGKELLPYRKPRSRIWLRGGWLAPSTAMAQGLLV